ncbi:MAG: preprotein translocase subunit Sec61beta [Candidatus Brockarchaeota archaeon]|nr:preprotein translocase subunit Sec61beta [Candidatus Brockarchaeota archaeon]MBO3768454.1 preprotein translocase subunit Sec61beta [Candidatus Brockarchaeota archaeon]MBO3801532.1 preprotein translocase subunit Sec61beta [Candidatus Brockarchaeota archaeon]
MSKKSKSKKSKDSSRLPPTGIGLVTFLDEDTGGPKINPEIILLVSFLFIVISLAAVLLFPVA